MLRRWTFVEVGGFGPVLLIWWAIVKQGEVEGDSGSGFKEGVEDWQMAIS